MKVGCTDILHCPPGSTTLCPQDVLLRRLLSCLIGMTLVALTLAAPARATDSHAMAHWASPVAANEHHHHDDRGAVVADEHHHGSQPAGDSDDGGHDHMPSHAHGSVALDVAGPLVAAPMPASTPVAALPMHEPPNLILPPHNRPPRFG